MEKIKLGIIGVGNMGTTHLKNILGGKCPEVEVTAVADINPERLEAIKGIYADFKAKNEELPEIFYFDDAIAMMESGKIDFDLKLTIRVSLGNLLGALIRAGWKFLVGYIRIKPDPKKPQEGRIPKAPKPPKPPRPATVPLPDKRA